ncbi:hypothetical protein McanMca71_004411 [Microsporum canis]|uniref:Uncharacterized protein n=1 Tax=Arthroderma otae (strain ATCC MYA-4605 / CBS 113480) TaxID=554155 RepID=C5FPP6_ARTOC|nr:uncharacterized protein MCYG_04470 [Microsporum canis CBS 113480]EEQ31651.1 predicted protein [Microsporum canis CBS 113480]
MQFFLIAALIACISSAYARDFHPEITPAPRAEDVHKRQVDERFIGWYSEGTEWRSYGCALGEYYAVSSQIGACCPTGLSYCDPPVACEGNKAVYSDSDMADCGSSVCDTLTIFDSRNVAATGIHSLVGCFSSPDFYHYPGTYYRATFALVTTTSEKLKTPTAPVTATKTVTQTPTTTVTQTPTEGLGVRLWDKGMWTRLCFIPLLAVFFGFVL